MQSVKGNMIDQNGQEWLISVEESDIDYICGLGENVKEYQKSVSRGEHVSFTSNERVIRAYYEILIENQLNMKEAKGLLACITIHESSPHPWDKIDNELDVLRELVINSVSKEASAVLQLRMTKDETYRNKTGLYLALVS